MYKVCVRQASSAEGIMTCSYPYHLQKENDFIFMRVYTTDQVH